jgi:hypothetical protein
MKQEIAYSLVLGTHSLKIVTLTSKGRVIVAYDIGRLGLALHCNSGIQIIIVINCIDLSCGIL